MPNYPRFPNLPSLLLTLVQLMYYCNVAALVEIIAIWYFLRPILHHRNLSDFPGPASPSESYIRKRSSPRISSLSSLESMSKMSIVKDTQACKYWT